MKVIQLNKYRQRFKEDNQITKGSNDLILIWVWTFMVTLMSIFNNTYLVNKFEKMKENVSNIDIILFSANTLVLLVSVGLFFYANIKLIKHRSLGYIYPMAALAVVIVFTMAGIIKG